MSGVDRVQAALLVLAGAVVVAFLVSIGLGLSGGSGDPAAGTDEPAAVESDAGAGGAQAIDPAGGAGPGGASPGSSRTGADRAARRRPAAPAPEPIDRALVRVEVLNAAGRAGLAREVTDRLVDEGFDVVFFGNAREFGRDSSLVIDRRGDRAAAQAVALALGIEHIRTDPAPELGLNATVILGADWRPPPPPAETGLAGTLAGLWNRLRGALPF